MPLRHVGKVKVRKAGWNVKSGVASLAVTVPHNVKIFFGDLEGMELEVYVDEENRQIIYKLPEGVGR